MHFVVPAGIDAGARRAAATATTGGSATGLTALGWDVHEHAVCPENRCGQAAFTASALSGVLAGLRTRQHRAARRPRRVRPAGGPRRRGRSAAARRARAPAAGPGRARRRPRRGAGREAAALQCVAAVVTTSRWTRHWLLDAYGLDPARVVVALPGVDAAPRSSARHRPRRRLLCVGAPWPGQGARRAPRGARPGHRPALALPCVGPLDRDRRSSRGSARTAELGIADRVRFAGPLRRRLAAPTPRADLLVPVPWRDLRDGGHRGTGARPAGAGVRGRRPAARRSAGHRAGAARLLVPPGDPGALAAALRALARRPRAAGATCGRPRGPACDAATGRTTPRSPGVHVARADRRRRW